MGEHFHIVTALPTLFFRRGRPPNQVPSVNLERLMAATDEAEMQAGVRTARDLRWKEGLESLIVSHPRILYAVMCAIVRTVHQLQTRLAIQASELTNYIVKQHGRY